MAKKLIIAGGGHASLPVIKMGRHWKSLGLEIVLISENPYLIYSGALPQFMAGFYDWDQTAIDLVKLCQRYGVTFVESRVESVNKDQAIVMTSGGEEYLYDTLLINVGARTAKFKHVENAVSVKPMDDLLSLKNRLQQGEIRSLLIAGGGAAGTELALNLSHPQSFAAPEITLLENNKRLISAFPKKMSDSVTRILMERSVTVKTNTPFRPEMAEEFDATLLAVGNRPGSVSISHDFEMGANDRILTDEMLRVKGEVNVFAAGDTADVNGQNYQPIGVHAVKQGVVLRHNIKSIYTGGELTPYKPYSINPLIMSDGADHAYYLTSRYVLEGRWPAILKYVLDMNWLEKYAKLPGNRRSYLKLFQDGWKRSGN
jgi:NADH dehydrogenase FAD-containing subunit